MDDNNNERTIVDKGKEVVKNETKKIAKSVKQKIISAIIPVLGMFFLILLAIGFIQAIPYMISQWFNSLFGTSESSEVRRALSSNIENIVYIDSDGKYNLKVENFSEQILEQLRNEKVDTDAIKYITEDFDDIIDTYIEAEVKTILPKTNVAGSDVDGLIIVQRASVDRNN